MPQATESVRDTLERAQKILSVVTEGGYLPAVKGASTAITQALAQLSEMERDHGAMEKRIVDVLEDEIYAHVNPESPFYNDCNANDLCAWCDEAKAVVAILGKESKSEGRDDA